MKKDDIAALVGAEAAVEWPGYEAGVGYGHTAVVRVRVLSAPVRWNAGSEHRPQWITGARVALMAPFRTGVEGRRGGFHEFAAGYESNVPSRQVLRAWGGSDAWRSSGSRHGVSDDEMEAERARRYAEQDAIREALPRLGLRERVGTFGAGDFELKGAEVVMQRSALAAWLLRVDPVRVAGDAIDAYAEMMPAVHGDAYHETAKQAVLTEVEQGLAVSDAELAPEEA